jgi:hypothetical protein
MNDMDSKEFQNNLSDAIERAIAEEKALEPAPYAATRIMQGLENRMNRPGKMPVPVLRPALVTFLMLTAIIIGFLVGNHGTSRISGTGPEEDQIEILRSEFYVVDFVEEDNTILSNN